MIITISLLPMTQPKRSTNSGLTTPAMDLPCFIHIANHQTSSSLVVIAIETSQGLLVHELLQKGYTVYAINPKAVNRYKDRHVLSKAKSDILDALSLGHLLRTDRHLFRPLEPLPEDYRLLDRLCGDLRKAIDEKSRIINQVISCSKEFYPKALEMFS
ncbi:MAG: transposase [Candidatus Brocadia sp.]|nr:MAG: transposase [Candidatus Brocadia sp.]